MKEALDPTEQKALQSLISAVLHQFGTSDFVSDEEIDEFVQDGYSLSEEQKTALAKLGRTPLAWTTNKSDEPQVAAFVREEVAELAGMYRHGSDETLDAETKKLIEEKRKQIINRLREKGKNVERPRD